MVHQLEYQKSNLECVDDHHCNCQYRAGGSAFDELLFNLIVQAMEQLAKLFGLTFCALAGPFNLTPTLQSFMIG